MWTNSYSLKQLGEFLQEVRKEKGLKQAEFAKMLGVSHTTLSNLEQGKNTSTATLQKVINCLGLRLVVVPKTASVRVTEEEAARGEMHAIDAAPGRYSRLFPANDVELDAMFSAAEKVPPDGCVSAEEGFAAFERRMGW